MLNHLSNLHHHHHWHSSLADKTKQPESLKDVFVEVGSNLNRVVLLFLGLALLFAVSAFHFLGSVDDDESFWAPQAFRVQVSVVGSTWPAQPPKLPPTQSCTPERHSPMPTVPSGPA